MKTVSNNYSYSVFGRILCSTPLSFPSAKPQQLMELFIKLVKSSSLWQIMTLLGVSTLSKPNICLHKKYWVHNLKGVECSPEFCSLISLCCHNKTLHFSPAELFSLAIAGALLLQKYCLIFYFLILFCNLFILKSQALVLLTWCKLVKWSSITRLGCLDFALFLSPFLLSPVICFSPHSLWHCGHWFWYGCH